MQTLVRPDTWVLCALFFVIATPFELAESGIAYLLKACAALAIVAYAVLARGARVGTLSLLAVAAVVLIFITNLFGWTERTLLAMATIVGGTLLGQTRGDRWDDEFQAIIFSYLTIHVFGLLIAAFLFYGTGQVIELHDLIFPHESRTEAHGVIGRLSGFHNEPGTYSQWTILSLYLFALTERRLFGKWTALIALSVILTVSLWGILAFGVIISAFAIESLMSPEKEQKVRRLLSLIIFLGIFITLAASVSSNILEEGFQFLEIKGELNTESGLDKIYATEFMHREFWNVFLLGRPFHPGFCPECVAPQDAGIGMTGIFHFGFLFFALLIVILTIKVYKHWGIGFVVPITLILTWKAHSYDPLLWIIIGFILTGPYARSKFAHEAGQLIEANSSSTFNNP